MRPHATTREVSEAVQEATKRYGDATVREFVPILVERDVRQTFHHPHHGTRPLCQCGRPSTHGLSAIDSMGQAGSNITWRRWDRVVAKRLRSIVAGAAVVLVCCGGPLSACLGVFSLLSVDDGSYVYAHSYPAPGPGCGDVGETESGRYDRWVNVDYAGVHCHPDHVDIDSGDRVDPRGVHRVGSNVFRLESTLDGPYVRGGGNVHAVTLSVGILTGGLDARAGITLQPDRVDLSLDGIWNPIYFFNIDQAGRWHVASHDVFDEFAIDVDSGMTPPAIERYSVIDHLLKVRIDQRTDEFSFIVDGVVVATVHPPRFSTYRVGVGLACSYEPRHDETCVASLRDYRYEVLRDDALAADT